MAEEDLPPEGEEAGGIVAPEADALEQEQQVDDAQNGDDAVSVEDIASNLGWSPKDKWRGDPEKWIPASQFLQRTADVNRSLVKKLEGVEQTVARMASTSAQLTQRAVEEARAKALAERNEAFENGDGEAFTRADQKLRQLEAEQPQQPAPPEVQDFVQRHSSWFEKDDEATRWAKGRAEELARQGIGIPRQLSIIEREAKQLFPEFFPDRPKPKGAPLNSPGTRGSAPAKKGFAALPAEVQAAALDYEKRGVCSKEEYAKIYFEEEA